MIISCVDQFFDRQAKLEFYPYMRCSCLQHQPNKLVSKLDFVVDEGHFLFVITNSIIPRQTVGKINRAFSMLLWSFRLDHQYENTLVLPCGSLPFPCFSSVTLSPSNSVNLVNSQSTFSSNDQRQF